MATAKKSNIMSLSMEEDMQNALKKHAKVNNVSVSKLIRDLVDTYVLHEKKVTVVHHEPDSIPIVLKVPVALKGDREGLLSWMRIRTTAIVERLAIVPPAKP